MKVVGIGTQDGLDQARKFRARHSISVTTLLFDETFRSWQHFRVAVQPVGLLYDAKGALVRRWNVIDFDELRASLA